MNSQEDYDDLHRHLADPIIKQHIETSVAKSLLDEHINVNSTNSPDFRPSSILDFALQYDGLELRHIPYPPAPQKIWHLTVLINLTTTSDEPSPLFKDGSHIITSRAIKAVLLLKVGYDEHSRARYEAVHNVELVRCKFTQKIA